MAEAHRGRANGKVCCWLGLRKKYMVHLKHTRKGTNDALGGERRKKSGRQLKEKKKKKGIIPFSFFVALNRDPVRNGTLS